MPTATPTTVVLLGPSGAGKSTLGGALSDQLGWLRIEGDRFPLNGIGNRLDRPWTVFKSQGNAIPLSNALRGLAKRNERPGAVLTVTSLEHVEAGVLASAPERGLHVFVLFGSESQCSTAFVKREMEMRRGLNEEHWRLCNDYQYFGRSDLESFRILAFTSDGQHRAIGELVEEVVNRTKGGA